MGYFVYSVLSLVGNVLVILLIVRAVLSFFPAPDRASPLWGLERLLFRVTEPVLEPVRRFLPATGIVDFSPLVAMVLIWVVLMILRVLLAF